MYKHLSMTEKFQVQLLEDAAQFIDLLDEKSRDKIIYNLQKARFSNNKELFKKLKGEIWEFRTLYNKTYYRLFAFWDKTGPMEALVIATHGLIKKTDKTPIAEIAKAEKMRTLYFERKHYGK